MHKPDHLVESDVREGLDWDPLLDDSRIVVKVKDGRVTLSGAVYTYPEIVRASQDAGDVRGVIEVDNELLVGLAGGAVADVEVAEDCVDALDADRFVPKGSVTPLVTDGWVTLGGQVRRHFQKVAAQYAVGKVDGVLGITNNLVIDSDPVPGDVADRINRAFRRNAILDDSQIDVSSNGHTIQLAGIVGSWYAKEEAEEAAWAAPGVTDVVDNLIIV